MGVAYLVNRYPEVSHSFIRREIVALERLGLAVGRYSVRPSSRALPDVADRAELGRTTVILDQTMMSLFGAVMAQMLRRPLLWMSALSLALKRGRGSSSALRGIAYFTEACWLERDLRRKGVSHLHAHFGTNPAMVARLVRRLGGPPYSFTVHGPDEFDRPIALDLEGKISEAKNVVAISHFGRGQLMRWSPPHQWSKLRIVRCGVDATFLFGPDLSTTPLSSHLVSAQFCCVARLSRQKGLPLLIEAAAMLRNEGISFAIKIVGEGELRTDLESAISRAGLQDYVTLVGACNADEVRDHMLTSQIFVLPSFAEGLPVVLMEAMALRRPVIATAIAGIPELVTDDCGWLIPSGSAEALTGAMKKALDADQDQLRRMGNSGRERVQRLHDIDQNASAMALVFDSAGS